MASLDLLTPMQLAACAHSLGWTTTPSMTVLRNGVNLTYRVSADDGIWYLRVVDPRWRPAATGVEEVAVVDALRRAGAPIVPFRTAGPVAVVASPLRWALCCAAAPGALSDPPAVADCIRLGSGLAHLHLAGDGVKASVRPAADGVPEDPVQAMAPYWDLWPEAPDLPTLVARLGQWCRDHPDDRGIIHGDAHNGNCAFADDSVTFFDTECVGWGPRSYDLAVVQTTWRRHLPHDADFAPRWQAFINGYANVRPLSAATLAAIPACVALRRLWLLLVAARMPWRYEPARFQALGVDACTVLAAAVANHPEKFG